MNLRSWNGPAVVSLHNPEPIEKFMRPRADLHFYSLGDLDEAFWPLTQWYGLIKRRQLAAVAMLYYGVTPPVFQALAAPETRAPLVELTSSVLPWLPPVFYAHLSPEIQSVFQRSHDLTSFGLHYKMTLQQPKKVEAVNVSEVTALANQDLQDLLQLYSESYPNHAFTPAMLKTGHFFGIKRRGRLVSAAGLHVYSPKYGIAAVANIATHPDHRGEGLATAVTARLCRSLLRSVDLIGLNVKTDNVAAISCYRRLGFDVVDTYHEWTIRIKPRSLGT